MARLSDLDISVCDISSRAYLNAPCVERVWFEAGSECGTTSGKVTVVTRALYGLKSSAKAWTIFFARYLDKTGYK